MPFRTNESFVAKRDNAAAYKYPTIGGITFPDCVKESGYQGVKATLEILEAEKAPVGPSQTPMADATNQLPTGSSS